MNEQEEDLDDLTQGHEFELNYLYAIMRIKHKGRKRKIEEVHLVPTDWFTYRKKGGLQCQFLSSMEVAEKVQLLNDLVERNAPVPPDWPVHPVEAVGVAQSYEEGLSELEKLKETPNVVADCPEHDKKVENALIRQVKRKQLLAAAEVLTKRMMIISQQVTGLEQSPRPKITAQENEETSVSHTSTQEQISNQIENSNGTSSENDMSTPPSPKYPQELSTQDSITSGFETDESQASPPLNGDKDSSGKENGSKESTEKLLPVSEIPVLDISGVSCSNRFETAVILYLKELDRKI